MRGTEWQLAVTQCRSCSLGLLLHCTILSGPRISSCLHPNRPSGHSALSRPAVSQLITLREMAASYTLIWLFMNLPSMKIWEWFGIHLYDSNTCIWVTENYHCKPWFLCGGQKSLILHELVNFIFFFFLFKSEGNLIISLFATAGKGIFCSFNLTLYFLKVKNVVNVLQCRKQTKVLPSLMSNSHVSHFSVSILFSTTYLLFWLYYCDCYLMKIVKVKGGF